MATRNSIRINNGIDWIVENRRYERYPVFKHAKIVFEECGTEKICVIQNISPLGAELKVGVEQYIPNRFWLDIRVDQKRYLCRQIWREGARLGLEFIDE